MHFIHIANKLSWYKLCSVFLVIFILLMTLWGWRGHVLIYGLMVLLFFLRPHEGHYRLSWKGDNLFLLLGVQYFVFASLFLVLHADHQQLSSRYFLFGTNVLSPYFWMTASIFFIFSIITFRNTPTIPALFLKISPYFLLILLVLMSGRYFSNVEQQCRIRYLAENVFMAPFFFCFFTNLSLANWRTKSTVEKCISFILLIGSLVVTLSYGGARGLFIAQTISIFLFFCVLYFSQKERGTALFVLVCLPIGFFSALIADYIMDCGMSQRILNLFAVIDVVSTPFSEISLENSMSLRRQMYIDALAGILQKPFLGHGIWQEIHFTYADTDVHDYFHVHNIYLSWLIWGGVFMLASGVAFLLSVLLSLREINRISVFAVFMATFGILGFVQMFDSYLADLRFVMFSTLLWPLAFYVGLYSLQNEKVMDAANE